MDPTRISIARILALGTRLTWQEAVAVAHEAAMVSDVCEAMSEHPSLVNAETCFITAAGELELPETADGSSPATATELLRQLLAGLDAPADLEGLVNGGDVPDLSDALSAFPVGNRRVVLSQLANRALGLATPPSAPVALAPSLETERSPEPASSSPHKSARLWAPMAPRLPSPLPFPTPVAQIPPPFVATPRPTVAQPPPFTSAPQPTRAMAPKPEHVAASEPTTERIGGPAPPAPDAELRRLRSLTVERERRNQRWSARLTRWIMWRPAFPDPRLLGGAAVAMAALVSMLWRTEPDGAKAGRDVVNAAPAATAATVPPPAPAAAAAAATTAATAPPSTTERDTSGRPRAPRPSVTGPRASAPPGEPPFNEDRRANPSPNVAAPATNAVPTAVVPSPPPPASTASNTPAAETRRPSAPAAGGRGRGRVTYSANDAEVAPPVMLRQQLPSSNLEPDFEVPGDWPYLELLIDEQGAVERVRLRASSLAPGQTLYRHRMLLAAAKAWQFEPAHLNGQAVRYVMRVPLEP